jgi:hypothetical protein
MRTNMMSAARMAMVRLSFAERNAGCESPFENSIFLACFSADGALQACKQQPSPLFVISRI